MFGTTTVSWLKTRLDSIGGRVGRLFDDITRLMNRADKQENRTDSLKTFVFGALREIDDLRADLARLRKDHTFTDKEFDSIRRSVIKLDKASGGFWKTASGYTMRIRDMSTDHIKRCLAGNFGGPLSRANMEREMKRRKEEEDWRKRPMPGKVESKSDYYTLSTTAEGYSFVSWALDTPIYVDKHTPPYKVAEVSDYLKKALTPSKPPEFPPAEGVQDHYVPEPEVEEDCFVGILYDTPLYIDANTPAHIKKRILDYINRCWELGK